MSRKWATRASGIAWVWLLRAMKGMTFEEIAQLYGVPRKSVARAVVPLGLSEDAKQVRSDSGPIPRGPALAYYTQKSRAAMRGIEWHFTPESWWRIWEASGKWRYRGRKSGNFVMARREDVGPYAPDNVRICTGTENLAEAREILALRAKN